ncbi:alpha-1-antichymotrypsin-like [Suncus etruscus]|uniref:alpha-1-antichymotrypsin-like n=1 Tax=Suncus etruscus TaxID=109475 RepID=UPI0021101EAC|nr:alpha-1-antichymotrypsin-like [Suncus etruscus]
MSPLLVLLLGSALWPHVLCYLSNKKALWKDPQDKLWYEGPRLDILSLLRSNIDFTFRLYKLLAAQNPGENIIFSPFSVSVALALLSLGAHGSTHTQILRGLKSDLSHFPEAEIHRGFQLLLGLLSTHRTPVQLNVSSAVFLDHQLGLHRHIRTKTLKKYGSDIIPINFKKTYNAMRLINEYVDQKTHGKIPDLVKDLDSRAKLMLVNCLFFKANWNIHFDPKLTVMSKFVGSKVSNLQVPIMTAKNVQVPYFRDKALGATVMQVQYSGNSILALFIFPDSDRLAAVEAALFPSTLQRWREKLKIRKMTLQLPKFSISGNYNLKPVLSKLGIHQLFSKWADFSSFAKTRNVFISQVVHNTVLSMSENGTEAATATGFKYVYQTFNGNTTIMDVSRPFLMVVLSEDTQSILFLVKMTNPQETTTLAPSLDLKQKHKILY